MSLQRAIEIIQIAREVPRPKPGEDFEVEISEGETVSINLFVEMVSEAKMTLAENDIGISNDKCCSVGTGPAGTDECISRQNSFCSIVPTAGVCSLLSDNC